jgi:uncharacterized protein
VRELPLPNQGPKASQVAGLHMSRYLHYREVAPDVLGIYSPFGHQVAFVASQCWWSLLQGQWANLPQIVTDDLVQRGFLVPPGFESRILGSFPPPRPTLMELWLIVTLQCNMACRYCVVEGNRTQETGPDCRDQGATPVMMTVEIAQAAIDQFFRHLPAAPEIQPRIVLYGGEPLLNPGVIRAAVRYIRHLEANQRRQRPRANILVISNGLICDATLIELFRQQQVSVSVSLDGWQSLHDTARLTRDGRGTFERAAHSLRRYLDAGLNTGICLTLGTHNVPHLPEIADYLGEAFGVPIQFQVPYSLPREGGNPFHVSMEEAASQTLTAFERLRRRGLVEGLTMRRVQLFMQGQFHHRDCYAGGGQWVVAPDGKVGPCHSLAGNPQYVTGNIRDPSWSPASLEVFSEWTRRMPVTMPECQGCPAIALCGGGCPYNALITKGSIWERDPQQCGYMRVLLDWLLEDAWASYRSVLTEPPEVFAAPVSPGLQV